MSLPDTKRGLGVLLLAAGFLCLAPAGAAETEAAETASAEKPADQPAKQIDWAKEREFWSFRSPEERPLPQVKATQWPRQALDYFILAQLEEKGLAPSPEANPETLLRRLAFDLTGLPPAPAEIEAFLAEPRHDAYEQMVERWLASPRFGERLASLWLPLARFAEDQAHQVGSDTKYFYPNAYKYREWVIQAFNRDLPYDQFIWLQLAADKLVPRDFFAADAPQYDTEKPAEDDPEKKEKAGESTAKTPATPPQPRTGALAGQAQFVSATPEDLAALGFLGLGPKYYNRNRLDVLADEWEDRVDTVSRAMLGLTVACARCHDHKFEPITTEDYYALAGIFASTKMVNQTPDGKAEKNDAKAEDMRGETLHMVRDDKVQDLNVFVRGNVDRKGPLVERRFIQLLSDCAPTSFGGGSSGREDLAAAIANPGNPLTARVIVNRIWGAFFGEPLVSTPSNLGHSGATPTHPELLDALSVQFMENGWSIKWLVREMVLSSTYRQSSSHDPQKASVDPVNESLWRMNRRRMSIEQWRDTILQAAGRLDFKGGASLELDDPANHRRTVHARVSRLKLNDLLMHFDYPDANVHSEKRSVTTTPMQKLFALNHPFMMEHAEALAERLAAESAEDDSARVERAYRLLFGRAPASQEIDLALQYLNKSGEASSPRWAQYAQVLLMSNELLYVD